MKIPPDAIYYNGKCLRIICAKRQNGTYPAKDFLDSATPQDWSKLDRIIKRLAGYFIPGHFVLTHGFEKRGGGKADKFPSSEMQKALNIKNDFDNFCLQYDGGKTNERKRP